MKRAKAGGRTRILQELLLYGGAELQDRLLLLMEGIWKKGKVVKDWQDAEILPIPKKGDLRKCDNWRGISLLDVVGEVFARILQDRLPVVAEKILPESHCGFRKGRGCVDMSFAVGQLVSKCMMTHCSSSLWTSSRPTTLCPGKCCAVFERSIACPQQCCL